MIFGMKIGAVFSYKLKRGLAGRRLSCETVSENIDPKDKVIWMHAASLGEYEQGLPVLEQLKIKFPQHKILVTFFSPLGYENVIRKAHIADAVCYLPFDVNGEIQKFLNLFNPEIFFTVKYDFWYNLLGELKKRNVKTYAVSALFYESQIFFKFYGGWFVKQLQGKIDWFFHQTPHSAVLAKSVGLTNSIIAGDTRFDRVKALRTRDNHVEFISEFIKDERVIVFGSSWEAEERIAELIHKEVPDVKIIMAPHDLKRVSHLKKVFPQSQLYSNFSLNPELVNRDSKVLIIDTIGLLSKIYSYADVAVVGGGFHSAGLHNILEAATFGVPVFFGNHYTKNPEADGLIANKGGEAFQDVFVAAEFIKELFKNPEALQNMGQNAAAFVTNQPNATEIVMAKILADFN